MVLMVGALPLFVPAGQSPLDAVLASPEVQQAAASFLEQQPASLITIPEDKKSVHCFQGEAAAVPLAAGTDPVHFLGSSDATTCVICLLADTQAGLAAVGHYDSGTVRSAASRSALLESMVAPQLWVVGGYCDAKGAGLAAAARLLAHYHSLPLPITLRLCCVGPLNTDPSSGPRCQSLALHLPTLTATPADWSRQRGPLPLPRLAQLWLRQAPLLQNIYDRVRSCFALDLIMGEPEPWLARYAQHLLAIEDSQEFLRLISTSPEHEGPGFLEDMRGNLRWLLKQSGPQRAETRIFEWGQEGWQQVSEDGGQLEEETAH